MSQCLKAKEGFCAKSCSFTILLVENVPISSRIEKSDGILLTLYYIEKNSSVNKEIRKKEKKRKKKHKLPLFFSRADLIRTPNI